MAEAPAPHKNVVLIGKQSTDKTYLATALAESAIITHGKRMCLYPSVYLVNHLKREKHDGKAGWIAEPLLRIDLLILN
ncbi:ATP-binding protein [Pseudomonas alcaligenes]|uniref:ATP-binding protein n=1 Tax=Aquipseudomonas alcaligenes TaxID=43263 RepID=UPI00358F5E18